MFHDGSGSRRRLSKCRLMLPVVAGVLALWPALTARADSVLDLTLYNVTVSSQDAGGAAIPFGGLTATGQLALSDGGNTQLLAQHNGFNIIDAAGSAPIAGISFSDLTGSILLDNGQVAGGSLSLTLSNADQLTADIIANLGSVQTGAGGTYQVTTSLENIDFSDPGHFAGLDISDLTGALAGTMVQFNYAPGVRSGVDNTGILSVTILPRSAVSVPLPAAFPAGMAILAALGAISWMRRRRRRELAADGCR